MLIVWLLWPEGSGPQIDQRAAWQQSVQAAKERRAEIDVGRATERGGAGPTPATAETPASVAETAPSAEPAEEIVPTQRRRLARPSELADRLDGSGWRSERRLADRSFEPAPPRPAVDGAGASNGGQTGATADTVQAALKEVVTNLQRQAGQASVGDALEAETLSDGAAIDTPDQEVAALSAEVLEAEPLPTVDLSDLDSLLPPVSSEEAAPAEPTQQAALSDLTTDAPDAAIEPFIIEGGPATDLRQRPRDDAPTWLKNAVTAGVADERPMIAIVIDDLGLNRSNTAALNDLPAPLTLAFLPYAGRIEAQTEAARDAGHELMVHLPMEPFGADWPGPDALTTTIDVDEFTARLGKNLDRFPGFVGVNNHMGSRLTADRPRMDVVMRELRKRDVLFLDSKTSPRSVASDTASSNGVPNTTRDVFLDHVIDPDSIKRQLARVERVARQSGSAVAIGHPHGVTIEALRQWLPGLEAKGFTLAPISAVVARRSCNSGVLIAAETCGQYLQAGRPATPSGG